MGWQDTHPVVHKAASAKGGRVQKAKGLATLPVERRREIASLGGKAKHANSSKDKPDEEKTHNSERQVRMADLHGDIDE